MLTMATIQEIREMRGDSFLAFPAWIEMNPKYTYSNYDKQYLIRAVSVHGCDDSDDVDPDLYTSHGNFSLDNYGKSWRLWYANGRERPDGIQKWERFSWDKD